MVSCAAGSAASRSFSDQVTCAPSDHVGNHWLVCGKRRWFGSAYVTSPKPESDGYAPFRATLAIRRAASAFLSRLFSSGRVRIACARSDFTSVGDVDSGASSVSPGSSFSVSLACVAMRT